MSKQSEAKASQNYRKYPNMCRDCANFTKRVVVFRGVYRDYSTDKDLRCTIGGFKVSKTATCDKWTSSPLGGNSI